MPDPLEKYLDEIGRTPLLGPAEEREIARTIEWGREAQARLDAGDLGRELEVRTADARLARQRFIAANLRLVVHIARRYPRPVGTDLLDLVQEGNVGLQRAVDKFDWRRGVRFSTYATYWIRQAIARALSQRACLIRLPDEHATRLRAALRHATGDTDQLGDDDARLHRLTTPTSLDLPLGDTGRLMIDLLAADEPTPDQVLVDLEELTTACGLLGALHARTRMAVEQRFGLADGRQRSYREVGEQLGVSSEAARRLVGRAIDAMRRDVAATA